MRHVSDILESKGLRALHSIAPTASVYEAMEMMAQHHIGALVVMEAGDLVGIVSERDYARKIALRSRKARTTTVRQVMSSPVITVTPDHSSDDCLVIMARYQLRHLPVIDAGEPVGMISIRDLVDEIVSDRRLLSLEQVAHPRESRV